MENVLLLSEFWLTLVLAFLQGEAEVAAMVCVPAAPELEMRDSAE